MMDFETWWEKHGQFCRAGGGQYEKTFAFRAWEAATQVEQHRCAVIAHSMGGDVGSLTNPDEVKLCANSIEWEILGRPESLSSDEDEIMEQTGPETAGD